MKLQDPPLKLKVSKNIVWHFRLYLNACAFQAFDRNHNYTRHEPAREALFIFHIKGMLDHVNETLYKSGREPNSKLLTLKLSVADRVTLSYMYKRVEVPDILLQLQFQSINQLTLN